MQPLSYVTFLKCWASLTVKYCHVLTSKMRTTASSSTRNRKSSVEFFLTSEASTIGTKFLPMGLGTSPAIWMTYVNFLLDSMPDQDKIIAIMDDLLLHSTRDAHMSPSGESL